MLSSTGLPTEFVDRAAAVVRRRTGLVFDPSRRPVLEAGLRTAMRRSSIRDLDRYLEHLDQEGSVLDDLFAEITIGETYFFRDSDQFALLRDRLVPDLFRHRRPHAPNAPIRIWSAGCASGEEPYSLAILLHQFGWLTQAQIFGTDISRPLLRQAVQARYSRWSLRGVSDDVIATHFKRSGDRFALIPAIRKMVEFRYLNLADVSYPSVRSGVWGMDLILCRNVLIYFAVDRVIEVAERLLDSLNDEGWLLLGSADPLLTELTTCRVEVTPAGLAYQRSRRISSSHSQSVRTPAVQTPVAELTELRACPASTPNASAPPAPVDELATEPAVEAARWYAARDYRRAADAAAQALASSGDETAIWLLFINALVNCGEFDRAEQACRTGRDRHGLCAELSVLHAFVLLEAGHHREAAMTARQALYLDPGLSVAHLALGTALLRVADAPGARRAFRNAERLLAALPSDSAVPGAGDEPAGRLAELARTQLALLQNSTS